MEKGNTDRWISFRGILMETEDEGFTRKEKKLHLISGRLLQIFMFLPFSFSLPYSLLLSFSFSLSLSFSPLPLLLSFSPFPFHFTFSLLFPFLFQGVGVMWGFPLLCLCVFKSVLTLGNQIKMLLQFSWQHFHKWFATGFFLRPREKD